MSFPIKIAGSVDLSYHPSGSMGQRRNSPPVFLRRAFMDFPKEIPAVSSASTSSFVPFCAHSTIKISSYLRGPLSLPSCRVASSRVSQPGTYDVFYKNCNSLIYRVDMRFFRFSHGLIYHFFSAQMTANHRKTIGKWRFTLW